MKKILIYMISALAAVSCIYPYEFEPITNDSQRLVISGDIIIGQECGFTVSKVVSIGEANQNVLSTVEVWSGKGKVYKAKSINFVYYVDLTNADPDDSYMLKVTDRNSGKEYTTPWTRPMPAPVIEGFSYECSEDYLTVNISADGGDAQHFKWDYEETWEYHADYPQRYIYNTDYKPKEDEDPENPGMIYIKNPNPYEYYYCWKNSNSIEMGLASTIVQSENRLVNYPVTSIIRNSIKLETLYSIKVNMRCISADAYAFLNNIRNNSNTSGDLFAPVPSDVRGNIRCVSDSTEWVVGYVDVCALASRRYFIDNAKEAVYIAGKKENMLFVPEADKEGLYNFAYLYSSGYRPVDLDGTDMYPSKTNMIWGPARCVDCRALGGSKEKPDYWPNNHE